MTETAFRLLADLLEQTFGLSMKHIDRESLSRRLHLRLAKLRITSFEDYHRFLVTSPNAAAEIDELPVNIMNQESYFFREADQRPVFLDLLDAAASRQAVKGMQPRVLSAGCAQGQEPYSLAIWNAVRTPSADVDAEILGIDINRSSLEKARFGLYSAYALRGAADGLVDRWFEMIGNRIYQIDRHIAEAVTFAQGNILDAGSILQHGRFDIIFCRNVLIYLSERAIAKVSMNLWTALNDSGHLILSQSEMLRGFSDLFEPIRYPNVTVYRKKPAHN